MRKLFSFPVFFVLSILASVIWVYLYSGSQSTYIASIAVTGFVCYCSYRWLIGPRSSDLVSKVFFILLTASTGLSLFLFTFAPKAVALIGSASISFKPILLSMFSAEVLFVVLKIMNQDFQEQDEIDAMMADDMEYWNKELYQNDGADLFSHDLMP